MARSGNEGPVGQKLEGVRVLMERYLSAGIASVTHDFYSGGRHETRTESPRRYQQSPRVDLGYSEKVILILRDRGRRQDQGAVQPQMQRLTPTPKCMP